MAERRGWGGLARGVLPTGHEDSISQWEEGSGAKLS